MSIKIGAIILMFLGVVSIYYGVTKKNISMHGLRFRLIFGGGILFSVGLILLLS